MKSKITNHEKQVLIKRELKAFLNGYPKIKNLNIWHDCRTKYFSIFRINGTEVQLRGHFRKDDGGCQKSKIDNELKSLLVELDLSFEDLLVFVCSLQDYHRHQVSFDNHTFFVALLKEYLPPEEIS